MKLRGTSCLLLGLAALGVASGCEPTKTEIMDAAGPPASGSGGTPAPQVDAASDGGEDADAFTPGDVAVAQSSQPRQAATTAAMSDLATLVADNGRFAWDLYRDQSAVTPNGNFVFSPTSISIALAMASAGAHGETADQMATTMHFSLPQERLHPAFNALDLALEPAGQPATGSFQLALANALWAARDLSIVPAFLDVLGTDYGAGLNLLDFAAAPETSRLTINQWVSDKTEGNIPDLLPPKSITIDTRLVLTNAVYFHGDWLYAFSPNSAEGTFHAPGGPVNVPMMAGYNLALPQWSGPGYRAAALPYVGGSTSMIVIVPDAGTFDAFQAALTADGLATILAATPTGTASVQLPRFTFKTALALKESLQRLGMTDAFDHNVADFSGIDNGRDLAIGDVFHQALIAVDEKGTVAAAATAPVFDAAGVVTNPNPPLIVDQPFLFAIRDNATRTILFLGRVLDPSPQ